MLHCKYEKIKEVTKPSGWILEYLKRDAVGITGNLDLLFADAASDVFGKEKVIHKEENYWSSWWAGETKGNWMEAVVKLSFLIDDENIRKKARDFIESLLNNQDSDGYIGIYKPGHRYIITKRFGEFWTQSRAMRILLAYYRGCGEKRILDAAIRMADNIVVSLDTENGKRRSLFEVPDEDGSKGHSLMIIDGLYELYKITRNEKYKDFSVYLFEDYNLHPSKFIQEDIRFVNLFDDDAEYIGHGPHTCEMLRLPLLLYSMTENPQYLKAFDAAVKRLKKNLSLSGSCKSDEFIGTFHQLYIEEEISEKPKGCIPIPSAGYEYCSTTELVIGFEYAVEILGETAFAGMQENAVYNASMAAKSADGKAIQYICCDNMYDASKAVGDRYDYSPTHSDAAVCCAPNACRVMPLHLDSFYLCTDSGFLVNIYGPSYVETTRKNIPVLLSQDTCYPHENTVLIKVKTERPVEFELALRVPEWCETAIVTAEGRKTEYNSFGKPITINRLWSDDSVKVEFKAASRVLTAPDGTFAVQYGPLLYSYKIESDGEHYYKYPDTEFYDTNYLPRPHSNWDYTLILDKNKQLKYSEFVPAEKGYPWENPSRLNTLMLDRFSIPKIVGLYPIGGTILRRTTFPAVEDEKNKFINNGVKKI